MHQMTPGLMLLPREVTHILYLYTPIHRTQFSVSLVLWPLFPSSYPVFKKSTYNYTLTCTFGKSKYLVYSVHPHPQFHWGITRAS